MSRLTVRPTTLKSLSVHLEAEVCPTPAGCSYISANTSCLPFYLETICVAFWGKRKKGHTGICSVLRL